MDTQAPAQTDWLVQTKLHPPLLREDVIPRPRLLAALREALTSHPLTLLSAPAGYGKTTLLIDFRLSISDRRLGTRGTEIENRVAWLTLDQEDNDPARFLTALIVALQRLNPTCGTTAQTLLASLTNPGAEARRIIGVLINDVLETLPDPFALILDDLHLIAEPTVFAALDYLLERLPPQMHLAIGTRHDPPLALARLRARGQVAELRLADLRFTLDEATLFLNEKLHLDLSPADLVALQKRTEGWPVGLRLLASSLDRIPTPADRTAFITHLAQTDRYVFGFLAEEVLNRQPSEVRTFLLQTSILSELTPALCQAVTSRSDAGAMLEELYRRNLFLVAIGRKMENGKWKVDDGERKLESAVRRLPSALPLPSSPFHFPSYRYHALFAEFLRQQLAREMPERVRDLHRRAAEALTDPLRATRHYLAAEMWEQAARTIEEVGGQLLRRGLLDTLAGWIHALPAPVRETRPRLVYLLGVCTWEKGDLDTAYSLLEEALRLFDAAGDEVGQGEVLTELANCAMLRADVARSAVLFDRALACQLSPQRRVQSLMGRAGLGFFRNDLAQAAADFEAATAVMEASADPDVLRLLLSHLNAGYAALPGGKERMDRILRQARVYFGEQISPLRVIIEELTAVLHIWRGELQEAIQTGEKSLEVKRRLGGSYPFVGVDAATIVLDSYTALGNYAAAERYMDRLFEGVTHIALVEQMMVASLFVVARSYWLQACTEPGRSGRLEDARRMYARICAAENPRELPMDAGFRARLRGMLAMSEGRYAEAERALREAVSIEQQEHFSTLFGSSRVLLAHFYAARDRPDEALAELAPILAESEQRGMLSFIVLNGSAAVPLLRLAVEHGVHADYAARLLDVLGVLREPQPVLVPDTGETLTPREVEVLRLMAAGASNREIAGQLVITVRTVKSHVTHILRKLNVSSRTQAGARARDLRIA